MSNLLLLSPSTVSISHALPNPLLSFLLSNTDSFVNSQEWTLSRSVPDLRLVSAFTGLLVTVLTSFLCPTHSQGVVGSISSGKSALVHRYLTGSYLQDESPEGGRFKKEVIVNDQSYLLLIRDEGGPPEMQVSPCLSLAITKVSLASGHVQLTSATGRTCTYGQANLSGLSHLH